MNDPVTLPLRNPAGVVFPPRPPRRRAFHRPRRAPTNNEIRGPESIAGEAEDTACQELSAAISQMKLPGGEACVQAKEPEHGVPLALRADEPLAQDHIAAALAMNGLCCGEGAQATAEVRVGGQAPEREARVAAGKPHRIGGTVRRLIGKRRERQDFRPRFVPCVQDMGINERKGSVLRQGDPLARRL